MLKDTISYRGLDWHCVYEYDAPQEEDDTDPAIPGIATLYSVHIRRWKQEDTPDVLEFIDAHTIHALEAILEANHEDY